jgi:hypothetical protein
MDSSSRYCDVHADLSPTPSCPTRMLLPWVLTWACRVQEDVRMHTSYGTRW